MGTATQIYRNGTILTMDSRGSVASALAVEGGLVLAVGTEEEVMAHAGPDTVVTDLRGRTLPKSAICSRKRPPPRPRANGFWDTVMTTPPLRIAATRSRPTWTT